MFTVRCTGDFDIHDEIHEFTCRTAKEAAKALSSTCRWLMWNEALMSFGSVYDENGNEVCNWTSY